MHPWLLFLFSMRKFSDPSGWMICRVLWVLHQHSAIKICMHTCAHKYTDIPCDERFWIGPVLGSFIHMRNYNSIACEKRLCRGLN